MDYYDYANPTRVRRDYPLIIFNVIKYSLLIILFISIIFLLIIISAFLVNQQSWIESAINELLQSSPIQPTINSNHNEIPSSPSPPPSTIKPPLDHPAKYTENLINLQLELFEIKLSLALIYFTFGLIAIISDDFKLSLLFTFTSIIGFLFSLVRKDNQIQLELMIYTIITTISSFIYCLLLRFYVKSKSNYYYGYLQS